MARDSALWILAGGLVFFTFAVLGVALWLPNNQAIYTLFAGILGGFAGGLMVYLRVTAPSDPPKADGYQADRQ